MGLTSLYANMMALSSIWQVVSHVMEELGQADKAPLLGNASAVWCQTCPSRVRLKVFMYRTVVLKDHLHPKQLDENLKCLGNAASLTTRDLIKNIGRTKSWFRTVLNTFRSPAVPELKSCTQDCCLLLKHLYHKQKRLQNT